MAQETEDPPKRRVRRREEESTPDPPKLEVVQPEADERGHVLRLSEDGSPRFSPFVTGMTAKAQRQVNTGKYESFEISTLVSFEPDRRFSIVENTARLNTLVVDEVNRMADEISAKFKVDKESI